MGDVKETRSEASAVLASPQAKDRPRGLHACFLLLQCVSALGSIQNDVADLQPVAFFFSVQPYLYSYLQVVQGYDVAIAGRVTQTFAFTSTVAAFGVSLLIKYSRRYRPFVTAGCVVYICGLLSMMLFRKEGSSFAKILGSQILVGMGGGLLNVPVQLGVQASANHQEVAAATAMFLTALEMGGAVGAAISGAVWTHLIPKKLHLYLPPESQADAEAIFGKLTTALSYPMGSPTRIAINRAYQETMNRLLSLALVASVPLIPLSLVMKNYKLDKVRNRPVAAVPGSGLMEEDEPEGEEEERRRPVPRAGSHPRGR